MSEHGRRESFSIQLLLLIDAGLIWLSFWIASLLREPLFDVLQPLLERAGHTMVRQTVDGLADITWLLFIVVPFTPLVLEMFGFYQNPLHRELRKSLPKVLMSYGVMVLGVLVLALFFQLPTSSRLVMGIALPLSITLILLRDGAMAVWSKRRARRGIGMENVIFAGTPDDVADFRSGLTDDVTAYWNVVGDFDLNSGNWDDFRAMINQGAAERVIFAVRQAEFAKVSDAIEICELQGVEAWLAADFIRTQIARPTFDMLGNRPMLVLRSTPDLSWSLLAKGLFDRVGAFFILLATLWLWPLVLVMIRLQSPGAMMFSQMRAGRYGKPFRMLKFRSMRKDAEARLEEVKARHGNDMSGPTFKLENDPRVFPFGRFMRRFSIDEIPQLINVLRGEMSLVGPRPLPVYEVHEIANSSHRRRMSMKPGVTCTWQISGRNQITDFEDWVKLDLEYIDNWSLWLDLKILLKTVPAVLFGTGAK